MMSWKTSYRIRSYIRSSLWVVPLGALLLEQLFAPIIYFLNGRLGWSGLGLGPDGARGLIQSLIALSLSCIVFTFSSLLVAIQIAGGQYTPRIIATTLLRNNVIRYTVGIFVFTFVFQVKSVSMTEKSVPQLVLFVAALLGFICIVAFLFLIDYAAKLLRPVSLVRCVGQEGLQVLGDVYPDLLSDGAEKNPPQADLPAQRRMVTRRGGSSIVVALNASKLVELARQSDGVIEFLPQAGDFVAAEDPVFVLYGGATCLNSSAVCGCVVFGPERTLESDPLFGFRILVDIAIKALSPAINDPTTAVLAIDQLHRLLRRAGRRDLGTDRLSDRAGVLRAIVRMPNWEDFVHLAFTEIRSYGAGNIQIARRLRAMLVNLTDTLAAVRQPALEDERALLDMTLERLYPNPQDLALARIPDTQGLGVAGGTDTRRA